MFGLTRWTEPRGISRLRQDMDELFDRFFDREDWMPGRVTRSLRTFHRDLDDLFSGFFGNDWPAMEASEGTRTFWPRAEMALKDGEHVLRLEVPGFKPDEVEVNVAANTLNIRGEQKAEKKDEESRRSFVYSCTLPEAVEPDKVKANLSHGVLEVRMPASPKLVGKRSRSRSASGRLQSSSRLPESRFGSGEGTCGPSPVCVVAEDALAGEQLG